MFDLQNLKGRIVALGLTAREIAPMLNISEAAIYQKLSGKVEFKRSEIESLMRILQISVKELDNYFF